MKIAICVPVYGDTRTQFTRSLADALIYSAKAGLTDIATFWRTGSSVSWNRENLAEAALAEGAGYILWLDADQCFPPDAIVRLLGHMHRAKVVGANYLRRMAPGGPVAHNGDVAVQTTAEKAAGPLEAVDGLGLGVCLMDAAVFSLIERPWFVEHPQYGEDGYFFAKLAGAGVRPHIDHALSMQVGHVAETVLTFSGRGDDADPIRPLTGTH